MPGGVGAGSGLLGHSPATRLDTCVIVTHILSVWRNLMLEAVLQQEIHRLDMPSHSCQTMQT